VAARRRGADVTRPLFTGSSAERAIKCAASEALPHVHSTSEDAARGHAIHAFLAAANASNAEQAIETVPVEYRPACDAIDVDRIPQLDGAGYAAEVAFAYDVELGTARELGRGLDRAYGELGPDEVPLTVDSFGLGRDGEGVFIGDYKSGVQRVTPARRNPQLLLGALAATRAYGRTRADVAIVYVADAPWFDHAAIDEWTLDAFAVELRKAAKAVRAARQLVAAGLQPDVVEGDHCRYCRAFDSCSAKVALARAIGAEPQSFRAGVSVSLNPTHAAHAYMMWKRAHEVVKRAGEALYAYASEHGGIDLGDGMAFGPVRSQREYVDGAKTRETLRALHGPEVADAACEWDSSKLAIKEALRRVKATTGRPLAQLEAEALAAIDAAGGIDRRESVVFKEYARRKELTNGGR
jgi:hypothetical protein